MNPYRTVQYQIGMGSLISNRFGWGKYKGLGFHALILLLAANSLNAAHVTPATLAAWDEQIRAMRSQLEREADAAARESSLLVADEQFGDRFAVHVESAQPGGKPVPAGLIHHWTGTEFLPNVRAFDLIAVLEDYDAYSQTYAPAVVESCLLNREGDDFVYRLKFIQKAMGVKAGLLAEFQSTYVRLSYGSGYSITEATQLTELENPGRANERTLSPSDSHGYIERIFTVVRYREVEGGVWVEVDAMTLSRDVPAALRWMVTPFIQRLSRQTMTTTLERLKDKVSAEHTLLSRSAAGR